MTQDNENNRIYNEFKELILSPDRGHLLPALKDKFRGAAVEDRGEYKLELLRLAQEPEIEPFHGPIFETLASLNSSRWPGKLPHPDRGNHKRKK